MVVCDSHLLVGASDHTEVSTGEVVDTAGIKAQGAVLSKLCIGKGKSKHNTQNGSRTTAEANLIEFHGLLSMVFGQIAYHQ